MNRRIAVFASGWDSASLAEYLEAFCKVTVDNSIDTFLFLAYPPHLNAKEYTMGELAIFGLPDLTTFDGALIFANGLEYDSISDIISEKCLEANIPVLFQGREPGNCYSISVDNNAGIRSICEHLINVHNSKTFVYFAGTKDNVDSNIRLNAVGDALAEHSIAMYDDDVYYTDFDNNIAYRKTTELCQKNMIPDVIICVNDSIAMSVCIALEDAGYNVPDDVIVTGFDYIHEGQVFYPSITTINQHFPALGENGAKTLINILEGGFCPKKAELKCSLILGESCGCGNSAHQDHLRRLAGREAFAERNAANFFDQKMTAVNNSVTKCQSYEELISFIPQRITEDHRFEGDTFHLLMDPMFSSSILNNATMMLEGSYSDEFDVWFSMKNAKVADEKVCKRSILIPAYTGEDDPHLYIFIPLHEGKYTQGYAVFTDRIDYIRQKFLNRYQTRLSSALSYFRQNMSMSYLNKELTMLSMRDPLTHVKNRNAWLARKEELETEVAKNPKYEFAIIMFDVNGLKTVNDTYGHAVGDMYIKNCCHAICDTFKFSSVYRVGGDEFITILTGRDYEHRRKLLNAFRKLMDPSAFPEDAKPEERISVASGLAVYNTKDPDETIADTMKRADEAMYRNKKLMKETPAQT